MQVHQKEASLDTSARADAGLRDLLMQNREAFDLFVEEAKRKGVRLSMQEPSPTRAQTQPAPMRVQDSGNEDVFEETDIALEDVDSTPVRAVIHTEQYTTPERTPGQEEILRKLRWDSHGSSTSRNLSTLLDRIRQLGIEDPNTYLSLRDAAQKSGVAERTLRRYIADGQLETEKVKGPRGWEHRVYVPALFSVLQEKAGAFERAHSNPVEEMGREVSNLCRVIVEQQSMAERRTNRLLDEMRNQSRAMDELRNEQRDARTVLYAMQDMIVKMKSQPPKKGFFERLFSGK